LKKTLKISSATLLIIILLLGGAYIALRSSRVQTKLTQYIASYLSDKFGATVSVRGVDIGFFNSLILEGLYVEDLHHDTLIYADIIRANITGVGIQQNHLQVSRLTLEETKVYLRKYTEDEGKLNLQFIIDAMGKKDTTKVSAPWTFDVSALRLRQTSFQYDDQLKPHKEWGMDYSHLYVKHINIDLDDINIAGDTIKGNMLSLTCAEQSGFVLQEFSGNATVSPVGIKVDDLRITTPSSKIFTQLEFTYSRWGDFLDYVNKVNMNLDLTDSRVSFFDIAYFAPALRGMSTTIDVTGKIEGPVRNLKGKKLDIHFGDNTNFAGNVEIEGLPDIKATFMHLNIKKLTTTRADLNRIPLPPFQKDNYLKMPENVGYLGKINFKGSFTGFFNSFVAYGNFNTAIGSISSDISLKKDPNKNTYAYEGKLSASEFNIGRFLESEDYLGKVSLHAIINGSGFEKSTINTKLDGNINSIELNGYNYKNITIEGLFANKIFDGKMNIAEDNINLDFRGNVNLADKVPVFDFSADIRNAHLSNLKILKNRDSVIVSSTICLNFVGDDIDNGIGNVLLNNTVYNEGNKTFAFKELEVDIREQYGQRTLTLLSDIADAEFKGKFKFRQLPEAFNKLMQNYLPAYAGNFETKAAEKEPQVFQYNITLKNTALPEFLFVPKIHLHSTAELDGNFNSNINSFVLNGKIRELFIDSVKVHNLGISAKSVGSEFHTHFTSDKVNVTDSVYLKNIDIKAQIANDNLDYTINWDNKGKIMNSANINGNARFAPRSVEIKILPSEIYIQNQQWAASPDNKIRIDSSDVTFSNLTFFSREQSITVDGVISKHLNKPLEVKFSQFDIENINTFTEKNGFIFDGYIDGKASLNNITSDLVFTADLNFTELKVNDELIGSGAISSIYDNTAKVVDARGKLMRDAVPAIDFSGKYYTAKKENSFDFDLSIDKTPLSIFGNYVSAVMGNLKGYASGKVKLRGTPKEPDITGKLNLQKVNFDVDYLNTHYSFTGDVDLTKNAFIINNLQLHDYVSDLSVLRLRDINDGIGIVNGKLMHNNFKNFHFEATLQARNMLFLNTTAGMNSLYYGTAFASGLLKFKGTFKSIIMDIAATTNKGTKFNIPLYGASNVSGADFVTFVSKKDSLIKVKTEKKAASANVQLNFDLEVTPDALVQLIFDPQIGDIIKGRGNGNIQMNINTIGQFNMYGDYVIDEGDYLFTLQNIINKKFTVKQGGTIKWNGDPYDADINLEAAYRVRTSLLDIMSDTTNQDYKKRILVECQMKMTDKLMNPTIAFDIDLPNSDQNTVTALKSMITTEQEMNNQIFGLLVMNRFMSPGGGLNNINGGGALSSNSSELLSNQLSNWLSRISDDFDLGVNYRTGNSLTGDEVQAYFSTQLFNNRVILDGNVGVSNTKQSATTSNNIVGDFSLEYKITDDGKFRVRAFNKSNDINLVTNNAPYTQGAGVSYRQEFNTLNEFFRNMFIRKQKQKESDKPVQ
jgi:hypothetical protein